MNSILAFGILVLLPLQAQAFGRAKPSQNTLQPGEVRIDARSVQDDDSFVQNCAAKRFEINANIAAIVQKQHDLGTNQFHVSLLADDYHPIPCTQANCSERVCAFKISIASTSYHLDSDDFNMGDEHGCDSVLETAQSTELVVFADLVKSAPKILQSGSCDLTTLVVEPTPSL